MRKRGRIALALALAAFPLLRSPLPTHAAFTVTAGAATEIQVGGPNDYLGGLAYNPHDNNVYVVDYTTEKVIPVNATTGVVGTPIDLSGGGGPPYNPEDIVVGPKTGLYDTLYITDTEDTSLIKVVLSPVPAVSGIPVWTTTRGIVLGPDNNIYFTGNFNGVVGEYNTTTTQVTFDHHPSTAAYITSASGKLWVTDPDNGGYDVYQPGLTFTGFLPSNLISSNLYDITTGIDGNAYSTNLSADVVTRIDTTFNSQFSLFLSPLSPSHRNHIVAASDGNLYVTDTINNQVVILTPTGHIVNPGLAMPSSVAGLNYLTRGPNGTVWLTEGRQTVIGGPLDRTGKVAVIGVPVKLTVAGLTVSGQPNNTVLATITDSKAGVTPASYTAQLTWGDGSPSSMGTIVSTGIVGGNSTFTIAGTHTFAAHGHHLVKIVVTPTDGRPAVTQFAAVNT